MSLFASKTSFKRFRFSNNLKVEGICEVIKENGTPSIDGIARFSSVGFCGHIKTRPEIIHTDKVRLVAFSAKIFEKIIDKIHEKKRIEEMTQEYKNEGYQIDRETKEEIKDRVRTELLLESPVRVLFIDILLNTEEKVIYIDCKNQGYQTSVLNALSEMLGLTEFVCESFIPEEVLGEFYDNLLSSQDVASVFVYYLYLITSGDLKDQSPFKIELGTKLDFKASKNNISISGQEVSDLSHLFDESNNRLLKRINLSFYTEHDEMKNKSFLEDNPEMDLKKWHVKPTYSYEISKSVLKIENYHDRSMNFNSKREAPLTIMFERYNSLNEVFKHMSVLGNCFRRWIEKTGLKEAFESIHAE